MKLTGKASVVREIKKYAKLYPDAVTTAIYQEGLAVDADMVRNIPTDTSRLKNSHYVTQPMSSVKPIVEVGVGTDYAIYVHERTELRHKVGRAKYLQVVKERYQPRYAQDVLNFTRRNVATGVKLATLKSAPTRPQTEQEFLGGGN